MSLYWHDPFNYLSFVNRRLDRLICESDSIVEHSLNQFRKRLKGKLVRIYKGFDPAWTNGVTVKKRSDLNIPENAMVVGCVANVRRVKGIPYLIRSAEFLPDDLPIYFLMIGPGMDSSPVSKKIGRTKYRNNFRTVGYTNEVFSYVSLCDLYIQPSLSEGFGRSVLEAMALAKPVIVTEVGGAKEQVIPGKNGFVVPVKSAKAIAEKIHSCWMNRARLTEMGRASRERIISEFNPGIMVQQNFDLFRELMNKQ